MADESLLGVADVLDQIAEETSRIGSILVIVIHPDQYQVESGLFHQICEKYDLHPKDFDLEKPQRLIAQYCDSRGIPYIDLLAAMRKHGSSGGLFRLNDSHYNSQGNLLAADEILKHLRRVVPLFARDRAEINAGGH